MDVLAKLDATNWEGPFPGGMAVVLEAGKVLLAADLDFDLAPAERRLLSADCLDRKLKNVSYRPATGTLHGSKCIGRDGEELKSILCRYYERSSALIRALFPEYRDHLSAGFTSFRPAEIAGRAASWRHDDTRLHIDAFPSRPTQGRRILRVFTNVNPSAPRLWRVGEPFEQVAQRFLPRVGPPFPGSCWLLYRLHITKKLRMPYDHLMLGLHDGMKADESYQRECQQIELPLPPGSTWLCFTDAVSHAAMSGQFAFEQTFYLAVDAMHEPSRSPLRVLERLTGRVLA
jgi:hypothetical protein